MEYNILFNVAAYIRLSCEDGDKEESNSVGNQRKLINEYISSHDDIKSVEFYIDDGYTGTNFNRPAFQRMIEAIENGDIDCVIVKDLSRFGRDYIDTGRYLERYFPEKGVRFISIVDGIDSKKQAYDMLLPIKNLFNEQYAKDISNKIQATVKAKQTSGEFIGAFACYGYKKAPDNKNKLIIDEYAASVVRKIFDLFVQGFGKQRIAKILNAEGILCPSEYKASNGFNYKNAHRLKSTSYWTYSTINAILNKEMYIGNMVQHRHHQVMRGKQKMLDKTEWIVVENTHEPIIDKETWERAQHLLKYKKRDIGLTNNVNIFAGYVKCGDCGRHMMKNMWRRKDNSMAYRMVCGTYKRVGKEYCTPHSIPMEVLEDVVLNDLNTMIKNVDLLKASVEAKTVKKPDNTKIIEAEINRLNKELERVTNLKKSIYEDYKDDLITKDEFLSYRKDYILKEELLSKQISVLEEKKTDNSTDYFENEWVKRLLELKEITKLDRDIIVEMINEITVYEDNRFKIKYNFSNEYENLFSNVYSNEQS